MIGTPWGQRVNFTLQYFCCPVLQNSLHWKSAFKVGRTKAYVDYVFKLCLPNELLTSRSTVFPNCVSTNSKCDEDEQLVQRSLFSRNHRRKSIRCSKINKHVRRIVCVLQIRANVERSIAFCEVNSALTQRGAQRLSVRPWNAHGNKGACVRRAWHGNALPVATNFFQWATFFWESRDYSTISWNHAVWVQKRVYDVHLWSKKAGVAFTNHAIRFCLQLTYISKTHLSTPTFGMKVKTMKLWPTKLVRLIGLAMFSSTDCCFVTEKKTFQVLWAVLISPDENVTQTIYALETPCIPAASTDKRMHSQS